MEWTEWLVKWAHELIRGFDAKPGHLQRLREPPMGPGQIFLVGPLHFAVSKLKDNILVNSVI